MRTARRTVPNTAFASAVPKKSRSILAADAMNVPVAEQKAVAEKFAAENLSAFNAAQNGYVDGIFEQQD